MPTMMPPKTPVSIDGMPMIGFTSMPGELRAHAHRGEEHDIAGRAGERGDAVVVREADGDADGEEQRQIAEDGIARCAMICDTLSGSHEKFALPTPSRMPATGSTETGSIMHLPIFCRREKAFLKLSMAVSLRFRG